MKTTIHAGIVLVTCFAFSCMREPEHLRLGTPSSFENLTLYPVRANETYLENRTNLGNYLTLKNAVDNGKVKLTETEEEDVNTLWIENVSSDTILILNGETVEGGLQNRMIAQDVKLIPHSGKLDVSVFCVEEGRWTGGKEFSVAEQSLPPGNVRMKTDAADQLAVWEEVKVNLDISNVESPTHALQDFKITERYINTAAKYFNHFAKTFENERDIVGVVAVGRDGTVTCDIFATRALFQKYYPNLLQSYATHMTESSEGRMTREMGNVWRRVMAKMKNEGFLGNNPKKEAHFGFVM